MKITDITIRLEPSNNGETHPPNTIARKGKQWTVTDDGAEPRGIYASEVGLIIELQQIIIKFNSGLIKG